jgi:hypothetical protein
MGFYPKRRYPAGKPLIKGEMRNSLGTRSTFNDLRVGSAFGGGLRRRLCASAVAKDAGEDSVFISRIAKRPLIGGSFSAEFVQIV